MSNDITQNPPLQPNALGGAPTTTMDVNGTIPESLPATPAPNQPQVLPNQAVPSNQSLTPNQSQLVAPKQVEKPTPQSLHARIFDGVLRTLGGGPIYVTKTDPITGATTREPIQQTRGQLGKSIVAGALAGMFGGMGARDEFGRHDPMKAAQQGYQAGTEFHEKQQAAAQKYSDDELSRRQMVMKTNLDLAHQQAAMAHEQLADLQNTVDRNLGGIIKDAKAYDEEQKSKGITDKNQLAIQFEHLTYDQALEKLGGNWSSVLAQVDGSQPVRDPVTGVLKPEPTYAILNPNVSIKMSKEQADEFAKFKPKYQNAYESTGGNISTALRNYASDTNEFNTLRQREAYFEGIKKDLGITSNIDLAAVVRKNGTTAINALKEVENVAAQGGDHVDVLHRLSGSAGGAFILNELGISNEQVDNLWFDKQRKETLAKEGAGSKAAATPEAVTATQGVISGIADPEIRQSLSARVHSGMTNAELDTVDEKARDQFNKDKDAAMKQGDPAVLGAAAQRTIAGDLSTTDELEKMFRAPYARANYDMEVSQQATSLGLNPTHYTLQTMKEKAQKDEEYKSTKGNSVGAQLNSFNTFLYHNADAIAASNEWKRSGSPLWNKPLSWIAKNAADDPTYIKYKASLIAPDKEFMNFLNANRAEHESDIKAGGDILDPNLSPSQIYTSLSQLAKTADDRAAALGDSYVGVVGTTYSRLLSESSKNMLKSIGIPSKAVAYSGVLPRNPAFVQSPQVQNLKPLTDLNVARRFAAAAGNDPQRTIEIAREHGWILTVKEGEIK